MRYKSNTGKYKSWKEFPWWLKSIVVGPFALLALMLVMPFVSFENREFDAEIEKKIERIHTQIARGEFRDVFLEADRELITNRDEQEFAAKLAQSRKYFAGKYEKTGGNSARYMSLVDKLKRAFGKPSLVANYYSFKSEAGSGSESFYWTIRGDEIKLADYELTARNY